MTSKHLLTAGAMVAISAGTAFAQAQVTYVRYEAGDVIFTGTPGVTQAMKPGDTFEVEIPGVGVLRNKVVAAATR